MGDPLGHPNGSQGPPLVTPMCPKVPNGTLLDLGNVKKVKKWTSNSQNFGILKFESVKFARIRFWDPFRYAVNYSIFARFLHNNVYMEKF